MTDTILWGEESDRYTARAQASLQDIYQNYDEYSVNTCIKLFSAYNIKPNRILDLGCAYGVFSYNLSKTIKSKYFGIDPGIESIRLAKEKMKGDEFSFQQGYSHQLPYEDNFFDAIILNMVLQWIPRKHLISTLAEINRVLVPGGVVYVQEFDPSIPKYSVSSHNASVKIFKDKYSNCFTAFPWYEMLYSECLFVEKGDDFKKVIFFVRKKEIDRTYTLKEWG